MQDDEERGKTRDETCLGIRFAKRKEIKGRRGEKEEPGIDTRREVHKQEWDATQNTKLRGEGHDSKMIER